MMGAEPNHAPPPQVPQRWAIGMLACCNADSWINPPPVFPKKGEIRRVAGIIPSAHGPYLAFERFDGLWNALSFVLVRQDLEPCSPEFRSWFSFFLTVASRRGQDGQP